MPVALGRRDLSPEVRRWTVLGAGVAAQASASALQQGLPALGPALRATYDLSLAEAGMVLAAANWGVMVTLLLWGAAADRFGERLVILLGLSGASLSMLLAAQAGTVTALVLSLALAGGCGGAAIAGSGRAIMGWFARHQRGLALGVRQMAVPLGGATASLVLPAAALAHGIEGALAVLAAALAVGALAGGLFLASPPATRSAEIPTDRPVPLRDRALWRLSIASGLLVCAQVAVIAFLVIFLHEHRGLSPAAAAGALAVVHVGGGVARIVCGWLSDRAGRRIPQLRLHGLALAAALAAAAVLADAPLWALLPVLLGTGILTLSWNGLAFTATTELAGYGRAGTALGVQGTIMRAISVGAGAAFGAVVAATSWSLAFALLASVAALGCFLLSPLLAEEERRMAADLAPPLDAARGAEA